MNCVTSKMLDGIGVIHGFGMGGATLSDYLADMGVRRAIYFHTDQMHSNDVVFLSRRRTIEPSRKLEADAFITNEQNVVCYVRTADCVPILMYDPVKKVAAAIHAGWRGTAKRIVTKVVERFVADFSSDAKDIIAAIGPSIAGPCYEVDDDVAESMVTIAGDGLCRGKKPGKWYLDLQQVNKKLILTAGIKKVDVIPICSHCDPRFGSYRRDRSEEARQALHRMVQGQVNFILLAAG